MKFSEISTKSREDLMKLLQEKRGEREALEVKVGERQQKDVRSLRAVKRDIARILTVLNQTNAK